MISRKEETMDKLIKILEENCPGVDFAASDRLIDDDILTSLDVVVLVGELNDAFGVLITVDHLVPENFNSVQAMYDLICRLGGK